ncbi:hypothetical protein Tcan_12013 [Toxocara canis]|uniref:Uncharacterized protein n=1 Tax=Toxocara canis TaxID=6265 RepID=A0A0B2UQM1_TOXCA|nr:hypothetical protein Tcan_12013 [Toxocara canis]
MAFHVETAFRTLEQIEADLDAARLQSAALAALIAPATKMFQFDEAATNSSFETTSPILLQHLRSQVFLTKSWLMLIVISSVAKGHFDLTEPEDDE